MLKETILILTLSAMSMHSFTSNTFDFYTVEYKNTNPTFSLEQQKQLDSLIASYGGGVSVFFEDMTTGFTYSYNEKQKYFIASLIKAPYCMYVYKLASENKADLNKVYTYTSNYYYGGTGKIQFMKENSTFTLEELIKYSILYSDNIAMKMLKSDFSVEGYREFAKGLGINYIDDIKNATDGDICAKDAGVYIKAIYDFINTNEYGQRLKYYMMSTSNPMIKSNYDIARKYGWAKDSFHDMAIIYAPKPYILVICSDRGYGTKNDFKMFEDISYMIENYSQNNN